MTRSVRPRHIMIAVGTMTNANTPSKNRGASSATVRPPVMAPSEVAISSVIPNRILAVPRSTLALATAVDVAMTVTMLVATA